MSALRAIGRRARAVLRWLANRWVNPGRCPHATPERSECEACFWKRQW